MKEAAYFSNTDSLRETGEYFSLRRKVDKDSLEVQKVLRIDDIDGREYIWDGTELYRLTPLKGKFGRPKLIKPKKT